MTSLLLQTKLYRPVVRPTWVQRPYLLAKLQEGLDGKLTLVAAPAGFGKTTLICAWLHQVARPAVWLSLDGGDNDLQRFLRYLITALQLGEPTVGQGALLLLQRPQPAPAEEVLIALLNDLTTALHPLILVLDDYHVIETPAIHQALTFLLEQMPPHLHLVMMSRAIPPLPLSRLRAHGLLNELRATDLRFSMEESRTFFQNFAHLALTQPDLARLSERTEGWVVGLQLAALSLAQRTDGANFVQNFSGSNRFILDYLMDEVLAQRSPTIQTFLRNTAILDRMCGPLCDALVDDLLGAPAGSLLQELEQANLFIVPLDDERYWYRYHHLFAEMLRQQLRQRAPDQIAELHQRASRWFEAQGLLDEAVEHARRAGDLGRVTQLVEQEIRTLIGRGFFDTAIRWLAQLPAALIQARPRLAIAQGWLRLLEIPIGNVEAVIQQAERVLTQSADAQTEANALLFAEIAALRAIEAGISNKPTAHRLIEEALRLAGPDNLFIQSTISYVLASFVGADGDWVTAQRTFQRAIAAAEASDNIVVAAGARYNFAMLQVEQGDLAGAAALLAQAESFAQSRPNRWPWPIVDSARVGMGRLCYERNELHQAQRLLQEGLELAQRQLKLYVLIDGYLALAWVQQAQDDRAAAQAAFDQAVALAPKSTRADTQPRLAANQAQLWVRQGEGQRAWEWGLTQPIPLASQPLDGHPFHYLTLAQLYLAQGPTYAQPVLTLLDRLATTAQEWTGRRLQIEALRALALNQMGRPDAARQALQQAVAIGAAAGYVRRLVDQGPDLVPLLAQLPPTPYRDKVLAALVEVDTAPPTNHSTANQALVEPLSEREMEVLRLVVAGASNQAIADQLVITVGTVKNHMSNILGKLGVRNRWEASRRAVELGLFP
ncbi:MAG: LuxR C-terminal-related transcriptional regulator [Caldilineaceae bacterium]